MKFKLRQVLGLAVLGAANVALAVPTYDKPSVSFSCVLGDCATNLSGQLSLQVIGDTTGEDTNVYFKFFNDGPIQSSVTQISFAGLGTVVPA